MRRFFREEFRLADDRVEVCLVGAEDRLFRPGWQPETPFHALFVGKLIPLHGLETILAAARLAPEVPFRVVGSGQLERLLDSRPANVTWVPWVDYEDLPGELQQAGCALGIFGTGDKTARVIPNKAFQALACACPLVTADTAAARELLTDGADALLIPAGDAEALAGAVRRLASDPALARRLGDEGRATYEAQASEDVLGLRWRDLLERADRPPVIRPRALLWLAIGAFGTGMSALAVLQQRAFRDGPLRRRQPHPGRMVDRPRPLPRGDRPAGPTRSPGWERISTRSSPRLHRLVAMADPSLLLVVQASSSRPRRCARCSCSPASISARSGPGSVSPSSTCSTRRRNGSSSTTSTPWRSQRRCSSPRSGSWTRTACFRSPSVRARRA